MSVEIIQDRNDEIRSLFEKTPDITNYINYRIECANKKSRVLDISIILIETIFQFVQDNPSHPDNIVLSNCVRSIRNELVAFRHKNINKNIYTLDNCTNQIEK